MANVKFITITEAQLATEAIEDRKIIFIKDGNNDIYQDVGTTVRHKMSPSLPADSALSTTSTNPIQNQAITNSIVNDLTTAIATTVDYIPCGTKPVKDLNTIVNGLKDVVLWTNLSPLTSFSAQTIILSDSIANYLYYSIEYALNISASTLHLSTGKISIADSVHLCGNDNYLYYRSTATPSTTAFSISQGTKVTVYGGGTTPDNTVLIPYKFIGHKQ